MIPVKIQCDCGQRYAFDAEPVDGRLASPVGCPACGADGTATANEMITRALPAPPVAPPAASVPRMRLAAAETPAPSGHPPARALPASAPHASQLGLVDRQQAEVEARAKVSWGDPPERVLSYLMIQSFTHEEASALLEVLYKERSMAVRGRGVKKILLGSGMVVGAAVGILYLLSLRIMPLKLMGILFAIGVWGMWYLVNGLIMVFLPKMQSGDVAEQ